MNVLLVTPPFTQVNTPYPATAFLKRFLTTKGIAVKQVDLGIELILAIFCQKGLAKVFDEAGRRKAKLKKQNRTILYQADRYLCTIDTVIDFLQTRETSLAYAICRKGFLPGTTRLDQPLDLEWAFGKHGIIDKACYFATLYLETLFHFIKSELAPDFGFSRYAEQLGLSATNFQPLHDKLQHQKALFDPTLQRLLTDHLHSFAPGLVAITIPFPGCLYGALQCGKIIRDYDRSIKIAIGGGYVNTELRELREVQLFNYTDFVTLDRGETPLLNIVRYLSDNQDPRELSRTFIKQNERLVFMEGSTPDASFCETGYPDYSDLDLNRYLSVLEVPNPMHRLWNDGKWNKLIAAQGCYWKKCAFCDVTLDYIKSHETVSARQIVDRMEQVIAQTGNTGFHFVDEAAPPVLLKQIALELLKRKLVVTWWTNIRFEKQFSRDLCRLLATSGCIAVSGGLETVSDRLLQLMNKGVTIPQAVHVLQNFREAGILVHAYLMYGFPTQTEQETIDSLEVIRQLFENDLLQSCYWHRFSLTAHSLVAQNPQTYGIRISGPPKGNFAWNDLEHDDPEGCQHERFGSGLEKAVYNFMFDLGLDYDLFEWFDFDVPPSTIDADYVTSLMQVSHQQHTVPENKRLIWLGNQPELIAAAHHKKQLATLKLISTTSTAVFSKKIDRVTGDWLYRLLSHLSVAGDQPLTIGQVSKDYEQHTGKSFQKFLENDLWASLCQFGLLAI